jgi:hypothetical protein
MPPVLVVVMIGDRMALASSSSILLHLVSVEIVLPSQEMTQGPYPASPTLTPTLKL